MKVITGITLTSAELAEQFKADLIAKQADPEKWRGLQYGHADLDRITGGLRKGEYVVVAGAQKAGKSTVALAWAQRFAQQVQPGEVVLHVSLEMSHDAIAGRVLSNLSDIEVTKFRDFKLEEDDWKRLDKGVIAMSKLPVLWNTGAYTIEGIEALIEANKGKVRVLVVDYFQLMLGSDMSAKRHEQLEALSLRLKRLTLVYEMSVLAVSQQTRESLKSLDLQKSSNTMAGTQSLARDCDLMVLILPYVKNGEEIPHMRKLHISISRNSTAGVTMDAVFSGAFSRFGAPADAEFAPMPEAEDNWWDK